MSLMIRILCLLWLYTFGVFAAYSQSNEELVQKLAIELNQIQSAKNIVGFSTAIVNEQGVLFSKGFGYSDLTKQRPYTQHTVQNIASISKTFIGIALLKAQELALLDLDDPINNYLPFKVVNPYYPDQHITIRHLATHTSSIIDPSQYEEHGYIISPRASPNAKVNNNFKPPEAMIPLGEFLYDLLDQQGKWYSKTNFLENAPGEMYEYSNLAAGLAGYVLEQATGEPFPEFTTKHIFEPLGMESSGWSFEDIYFPLHTKLYSDPTTELAFYQLVTYPDGGLITSANDLSKYLIELIKGYTGSGTILSNKSFKELFSKQLSDKNYSERDDNPYNDEYNSGIFMGFSAHEYIGHTGGDPGVSSFMFFDPQTLTGRILLVNTDLNQEGVRDFLNIWSLLGEYEEQLH